MKKFFFGFLVFLVLLAAAAGFLFGVASKLALLDVFLSLSPAAPMLSETSVMVLGVDAAGGHRSDTIMVLHINPEKRQATVISIPRDTLVVIPGRGLDKINHAFAYGGTELARQTVEDFLKVKVPHHIIVDLKGIAKLIDEVGGVMVDVEKRMYYVDYSQDLHIDLQPGLQRLNGEQAMGYLRFRHTDNDFARIGREQKFLNSIASQLMKRDNLIRSPGIFLSLLGCVDSSLNSREILGLSLALRSAYETGQVQMATIPGSDLMIDGIYYWRPDEGALQQIVEQYIFGRKQTAIFGLRS
jgi:LCP family protein required for cell wall assembly